MATDTAHINLELASGKNEVTAPFHQTAQRRRSPIAEQLPSNEQVLLDVPLGSAEASSVRMSDPIVAERAGIGRPTWIVFIGAIVAVAAAVWWVMFQRLPDIDPREVVQRNLGEARSAMAEGRYTDPSERSAFHYYSTVLALDPANADAIAGIDAIADRHLTDTRVLLAEQRIAEAGVALEKARRVRPNHGSLPDLDMQLRAELRKILAAANAALMPIEPPKTKAAKVTNVSPARTDTPAVPSSRPLPSKPESDVPSLQAGPSESRIASLPSIADHDRLALSRAAVAQTRVTEPATPVTNASGSTPIIEEPAIAPATPDATVRTVTPKLIKMVQPEYPQEALMRGMEGWVDVSLEVNAAGDVVAPRIEDTSRGRLFNRAALAAVRQWKYEPPADGETSERVRVRVQFRHSK